jgi:pyrimidine operon attenuation protein/uracil phosphoribosyltransferase
MSEPRPANKVVIMTEEDMSRTITRLAHEIIEKNPDPHGLALVGIHTRGAFPGERLHHLPCETSGCEHAAGNLDARSIGTTSERAARPAGSRGDSAGGQGV